jgi:hypothetical protein
MDDRRAGGARVTGRKPAALAFVAYLAITLVYTWPLPRMFGTGIAHDPYDPALNAWIVWWSTHAVPLTAHWWNAPFFYPAPGVLAFSEHLLGLAPISAPIIALTDNALAGYNAALIASFVLSGIGAYTLAYILTRRADAAFVAGLAYAFAPYRLAHVAHIQVLSSYWIPFCLAALHLYDRTRRTRWLVAAAATWLLQSYANGYYLFFLATLLLIWFAWHVPRRWTLRQTATCGLFFAVAGLLVVPVLIGYWRILHGTYDLSRSIGEIRAFSADIAGLLLATDELLVWSWVHVIHRPESNLFPGVTIVLLAAYAIYRARPLATDSEETRRMRRLRLLLAVATVVAAIAMLLPIVFGRFRLDIGGLRLLSIARADKPAMLALIFGLGWIGLLPRVRAALRRRSPLAFYLAAAFLMWVFALGPDPTILDQRALYQAPYGWLMRLPAFSGLRVPARFWMLTLACLAPVAALAVNRIDGRRRRLVIVLASLGLLIDGWPRVFMVTRAPDPRPAPSGVAARLDLPVGDGDALAMLQQTLQPLPLYNGYSGYFAPHYYAMSDLLANRDPRILLALSAHGPLGVVVDHAGDADGSIRRYVAAVPGAQLTHDERGWSSYRLPASGAPELPDRAGRPLHITSLDAYPSAPHAARVVDGDLVTRWSGGPQQQSAELIAELDGLSAVHQVVIDLGGYITDFAARLQIDVSADGKAWDTAWLGDTALQAYYGALRHPREVPLVFQIDRQAVKFIRLRQTGFGTHDWSIAELHVLQ